MGEGSEVSATSKTSRGEKWEQEFRQIDCIHCGPPIVMDRPTELDLKIQDLQRRSNHQAIMEALSELIANGAEASGDWDDDDDEVDGVSLAGEIGKIVKEEPPENVSQFGFGVQHSQVHVPVPRAPPRPSTEPGPPSPEVARGPPFDGTGEVAPSGAHSAT